jgi:hypothetical protein
MKAPSEPTAGEKLDLNALNGALLHITVHELVKDIETSFGKSNAIRADIVALDGDHKGEEFADVLIFPRVLISQLTPDIGETVVGRLGKGDAKPGKSAPWLLQVPTKADLEIGERYEKYAAEQAAAQSAPF